MVLPGLGLGLRLGLGVRLGLGLGLGLVIGLGLGLEVRSELVQECVAPSVERSMPWVSCGIIRGHACHSSSMGSIMGRLTSSMDRLTSNIE